jgi:glycosyltransferase involved in cell wall biosynthesis
MNKRLLIVCDPGHCSHRIPYLANELVIRGWEVAILAPRMADRQRNFIGMPPNSLFQEITTPEFSMIHDRFSHLGNRFQYIYRVLEYKRVQYTKKLLKKHVSIIGFEDTPLALVDEHSRWINSAVKRGDQFLKSKNFGIVLSSSSPLAAHIIARELALRHEKIWCADFRDLWALNHTRSHQSQIALLPIEKQLLDECDGAITVSKGFAEKLASNYSGPIEVIHNSYGVLSPFRDNLVKNSPIEIVYTGSIYDSYQNYGLVLRTLDKFNSDEIKANLTFVGPNVEVISRYYKKSGRDIPSFIQIKNSVDRSASHLLQHNADLGLLLNWEDSGEKGWESTKLFEYLAAGLPIIATGGNENDAIGEILSKTNAGVCLRTEESLFEFLRSSYVNNSHGLIRKDVESLSYNFRAQATNLDLFLTDLLNRTTKGI